MPLSKSTNNAGITAKIFALFFFFAFFQIDVLSQVAHTEMRNLTSLEISAEMAPGINLFNTLDAICTWCSNNKNGLESETVWGNPYTKPEMIKAFADRGFKTLRIPVTWYNHMGPAPDFVIDTVWMDRVEQVANYALDNNMYVIINMHHEDLKSGRPGTWLTTTYAKQEEVSAQLEKVWTQIATRFIDYSDYVIFETMNEPREPGGPQEWSGGTSEHRNVMNDLNLAAVNAIRATGGNNEKRFIMLPQVGANVASASESLIIPNDDPNTIVSVHAYYPYWFCIGDETTVNWGTPAEVAELENAFVPLNEKFVSKGIGVVMGEWGASHKDNYAQRINYYEKYTNVCKKNGITPITWIYDFNRNTLTWEHPLIIDAILQAYDSTYIPADEIVLDVKTDTLRVGETLQLTAAVLPDSACIKTVAWTSSNKYNATVSSSGFVMALNEGLVKIKALTLGKSAECTVYVVDDRIRTNFFIEAEDYSDQKGVEKENCLDTNKGENLGNIQKADWTTYNVRIDSTGIYNFTARVATDTQGGSILVVVNNQILDTVYVDGAKSNGWQNWYTTEPVEIKLNKGQNKIKLYYTGTSFYLFNLNWFKLDYNRQLNLTAAQKILANDFDIKVYPNPFSNRLKISYRVPIKSEVQLMLLDMNGRTITELVNNTIQLPGIYNLSLNGDAFQDGMYFLTGRINHKKIITKLVKH